ncbi:polysaccharide deacetylase family protein [Paenibacillus sp. GCM10023252]|uniref:polysaccharide deacetylase family protein n=1 Tax=Paenibacillus sp. GCM10023252 TaxID=3252649 RepID=UPI00360CF32F
MPQRQLVASTLISLVILTSACSTSESNSLKEPSPEQVTVTDTTTKPTATPSPASTIAQPDSTPTSAQAEEAKVKYKMNSSYRFEPVTADAPDQMVLLTFDDGPKDTEVLTRILDILDQHQAKAIFFVNGYRVKQKPELLELIADRAQTIGNHSWDHVDLKKESEASVRKQLEDVQVQVKSIAGLTPKFFRPPFGSGSDTVKTAAADEGMLYMTWSNGSLDWDAAAKNKPDVVIANVMEQLHPGANILMHELAWTADALDTLLTKLEKAGYGFIDPATIDLKQP